MSSKVIVIFPAFNEEKGIEEVLKDTCAFLYAADYDKIELVVVDDGSTDQTAARIRSLQQSLPITLLEHETNKGLGLALRTGLLYALQKGEKDDIIVTSESDGTQKARTMGELIVGINQGADIAVANPLGEGGFVKVPLYRRVLSQGVNKIYHFLFPIPGLHSYTNLLRAYRFSLLQKGLEYYGERRFLDRKGFDAVPDLILKLRMFNPKVIEVPIQIDFSNKAKPSSMGIVRTIFKSLQLCVEHWWKSHYYEP